MSHSEIWTKQNLSANAKLNGAELDYRHFPTEYVLRSAFSSHYFGEKLDFCLGDKVLDIGCLYANNLVPFHDRGLQCFGVDVSREIVSLAEYYLQKQGIHARIEIGTNTRIPFENDFFSTVLSVATIHYEENFENVRKGIIEMARVTKSEGTLIISTAGQKHDFVSTAKKLGINRYQIAMEDFRKGQIFSFFEDAEQFKEVLSESFLEVKIATIHENYPEGQLEFYLARCKNPHK